MSDVMTCISNCSCPVVDAYGARVSECQLGVPCRDAKKEEKRNPCVDCGNEVDFEYLIRCDACIRILDKEGRQPRLGWY